MEFLVKISHAIARLCQFIGGVSLVIIVLVTIADVAARYVFKLTGGELGFTVKGSVLSLILCCLRYWPLLLPL